MNKDHKGRPITPKRALALQERSSGPASTGSLPLFPTPMVREQTTENQEATSSTTETTDAGMNPLARAILERTITTVGADDPRRRAWVIRQLLPPAQYRLYRLASRPSRLFLRHPLRSLRFSLHQRFGILPPRLRIVESGSRAPAQD
jgi:hypothetical protein